MMQFFNLTSAQSLQNSLVNFLFIISFSDFNFIIFCSPRFPYLLCHNFELFLSTLWVLLLWYSLSIVSCVVSSKNVLFSFDCLHLIIVSWLRWIIHLSSTNTIFKSFLFYLYLFIFIWSSFLIYFLLLSTFFLIYKIAFNIIQFYSS
jgi:hypothetical protein